MIIGISGRKQGGKGTLGKFIAGLNAFNCVQTHEFNFADTLKDLAVDLFGVPRESAYGTDAQKNEPIGHLRWEDLPFLVFEMDDGSFIPYIPDPGSEIAISFPVSGCSPHCVVDLHDLVETSGRRIVRRKFGEMTGRQFLQVWGTQCVRRMCSRAFTDRCIRDAVAWESAANEFPRVATILDVRFPDEVDAIQAAGGVVIRLTRDAFGDPHQSERALDPDQFDWNRFDEVVANATMGMAETCLAALPFLVERGIVPDVPDRFVEVVLADIDAAYGRRKTLAERLYDATPRGGWIE